MGTLRSTDPDCIGRLCNDVVLGEPVERADDVLVWDDSAFPTGVASVVDDELVVTVDEEPT